MLLMRSIDRQLWACVCVWSNKFRTIDSLVSIKCRRHRWHWHNTDGTVVLFSSCCRQCVRPMRGIFLRIPLQTISGFSEFFANHFGVWQRNLDRHWAYRINDRLFAQHCRLSIIWRMYSERVFSIFEPISFDQRYLSSPRHLLAPIDTCFRMETRFFFLSKRN